MNIVTSLKEQCKVSARGDAVTNSECVYTFHSPHSSVKGILVNLTSYVGTAEDMVFHSTFQCRNHTQLGLFVRIVRKDVLMIGKINDISEYNPSKKISPIKHSFGRNKTSVFNGKKYHTYSDYSVIAMTSNKESVVQILAEIPYMTGIENVFPSSVAESVESIIHTKSFIAQNDAVACDLDQDEKPISKYSYTLEFVPNGEMICLNSNNWVCEKSGRRENLWLNLSDGYIGGGRKNWDGTGGSNGALDHFYETDKKYPLVVKLGTITSDPSTADCFSYACDENCMVYVPNLKELLIKHNIHLEESQKRDKTTTELELELNSTYASDEIAESNRKLVRVFGPGLRGLRNIGNSCYINSILQMCFSGIIPELSRRYGTIPNGDITKIPLLKISPIKASLDLLSQTAKIACALTSRKSAYYFPTFSSVKMSDYDNKVSSIIEPKYSPSPRMFKHIISNNHIEFHSNQQQDAAQFLLHLFERLGSAELSSVGRITNKSIILHNFNKSLYDHIPLTPELFSFKTVSRIVSTLDNRVKLKENPLETMLSLRIPISDINTWKEEETHIFQSSSFGNNGKCLHEPIEKILRYQEFPRDVNDIDSNIRHMYDGNNKKSKIEKSDPTVLFKDCLHEWSGPNNINDLRWLHLDNKVSSATEEIKFLNFPPYLIIHMQRYELGSDWVPRKLDVTIDMPEEIDLTNLRSRGLIDDDHLTTKYMSDIINNKICQNDRNNTPTDVAYPPCVPLNDNALNKLLEMGFDLNISRHALTTVGGSSIEDAMNWIIEQNSASNCSENILNVSKNDVIQLDNIITLSDDKNFEVSERTVISLVETLGYLPIKLVRAALIVNDASPDIAADCLLTNTSDLDTIIREDITIPLSSPSITVQQEDGKGKYSLIGLVSHIGKNTNSGHYVAHLKKCSDWIMFNDEQVVLSEVPPINHAYLYLFRRMDSLNPPNN